MPPEDTLTPDPLELLNKQLDRYQAIISRLANNQVQVKTWCVTALGALAALAVNNGQQGPLVIGVLVVVAFFFLDAYYLSLERHFRCESHRTVEEVLGPGEPNWNELLRIEGPGRGQSRAWEFVATSGRSLAVSPFYLGLVVMLVVGFALAG